jgi:hypothetical protein
MHAIQVLSDLLLDQITNLECVVYRVVRVAFRAVAGHFNLNGVLDQLLVAEAGRAAHCCNAARLDLPDAAFLSIFLVVVSAFAYIAEPYIVNFRLAAAFRLMVEVVHLLAATALVSLFRHLNALR